MVITPGWQAADWQAADWQAIAAELDAQGCARTPRLLTPAQCRDLAALYDKPELFRSTIDMARHRFGSGQYRYFTHDLPEPVRELREALYPRLLVIARDWAGRLGRPAPWPDTLGEWVEMCHRAGQGKSAQILLRYQAGDWNALHRDVFGDLVFPLQVVVGLDEYGTDYTSAVPGYLHGPGAGPRADLHHQGPAGAQRARLVRGPGPARREHRALRTPARPRPGLPRRLSGRRGRLAVPGQLAP